MNSTRKKKKKKPLLANLHLALLPVESAIFALMALARL